MDQFAQAFALGVASAASPCLLPLYPGFIAYLAGNSRSIAGRRAAGLLGLLVLAGVLTVMLAIGLLLVGLAVPVGPVLAWLVSLIDLVLIVLGLLLIAGRNPFERLPGAQVPVIANPYGQAYVYGLMLGPLACPAPGRSSSRCSPSRSAWATRSRGSPASSCTGSGSDCRWSRCR